MDKSITFVVAAGLLSAPVPAVALPYQAVEVRPSVFVGARLQMSLGHNAGLSPRASFALAPMQSRISGDGVVKFKIGEGIALNLTSRAGPTLTLDGVPADTALGLMRGGQVDGERKLGVSTAGWIGIGAGVVLVAGAVGFARLVDEAEDNSD